MLVGDCLLQRGDRRRTPGGVFLQLIKTDQDISDRQKALIFTESRKETRKVLRFVIVCLFLLQCG